MTETLLGLTINSLPSEQVRMMARRELEQAGIDAETPSAALDDFILRILQFGIMEVQPPRPELNAKV